MSVHSLMIESGSNPAARSAPSHIMSIAPRGVACDALGVRPFSPSLILLPVLSALRPGERFRPSPELRRRIIPPTAPSDRHAPPVPAPIPPNAPRMSKQTRYEIIRDFETQLVYARTAFPMGTKGLQLKQGVITPNGEELRQALALWGPAIKPGDPAHISFVQIKDDHIHFEINGGPMRRQKWYQRIQVSGANGSR